MFLDDIADTINLSGATKNTYTITNYSGKKLVILGSIKILNYTDTEVIINLGAQTNTILGNNLKIQFSNANTLVLIGAIFSISNKSLENKKHFD